MDLMLVHPKEFEALYNCSFYNVSYIPLEQRQHTKMGCSFIVCFFIFEILYIPCVISIKKHCDNACYKMMFYIAIIDILCLFVNSLFTGYLAVTGAVYCTHPTLIYLGGTFGLACWACESTAEVVLALNRCIAICSPKWEDYLFRGYKTWLWMGIPTFYAFYWALFTKPILYSGLYMSWFFNPHVGYYDDFGLIYNNQFQVDHNYFVIVGLTATYITFAVLLHCKSKKVACQNSAQQNYSHKMIFLQVIMISMVNAVAAGVYIVMQLVRISQLIIYLGSIAWVLAHGIPPVIYLALNRTMRKDSIEMTMKFCRRTHKHFNSRSFPQLSTVKRSDLSKNSTVGAGVH